MPIYPYSFQLPPLNVQDIPNDGAVGEFLGISAGGVLDWLPVASGGGDMLKSENLSGLASYPTARTNLGLGTGDSPTFKNLTISTGTIATSAPVTISQTWNGTGSTVFKALVVNATTPGTTSSASSLLLDLQVGGVGKLAVRKDGSLLLLGTSSSGVSSASSAAIRFTGSGKIELASEYSTCGIQMGGAGTLITAPVLTLGGAWVAISNDAFGNNPSYLVSEAANTLALRNGALAQTFRVYNTFPGTGNNEYAEIAWVGNFLLIRPAASGTATVRGSVFGSGSSETYLDGSVTNFRSTSLIRWSINSSGHFLAGTDNTYDIGASGANRPKSLYLGTNIVIGTAPTTLTINPSGLSFSGRFIISESGADGVFGVYNSTASGFNRLQFGGVTDAFPAVARDGAGIKFTGAAAGSTAWVKVPAVAVSALPLAATAGVGARAFVNDAIAPVFGSAVTGGGSVPVPVYSTGSAWNVG